MPLRSLDGYRWLLRLPPGPRLLRKYAPAWDFPASRGKIDAILPSRLGSPLPALCRLKGMIPAVTLLPLVRAPSCLAEREIRLRVRGEPHNHRRQELPN